MRKETMTERFEMRLGTSTLAEIDNWRAKQNDSPSRAEAIRRLIEDGLARANDANVQLNLSPGEKLILLSLRDLFTHLNVGRGEIDLDFIAETIFGGHSWALQWEMPGLFHGHEDSKQVVSEVVDILDMWSFLESSYESLSKKDKDRVAAEAEPLGKVVKFSGFDGNNETGYMGVAQFLTGPLGRFSRFKGRELNSHMPTLEAYRRMFAIFEPIRRTLIGRNLTVGEIISILAAWTPPSRRRDNKVTRG